ncbi:hypothetical protein K0028_04440 [Curtobacterium flaccumfaciens pv. flaccumfaciens]|uniref:hypothetical protein n=1 Tax=Curtobacterium flaccumfaciens TaxID=2035 RepID=UPI0021B0D42A|nr:hypothetical protein [Curtobacterium flaccumfaciens]QYI99174.1 hypothetical protein K0028_04440 [Curtobacterium flaccumfaciens pv. flaccumfaciens]
MFRPDFGHLYKYISSVGLALLAAAIVLPWFVLQANEPFLIKTSALKQLTSEAQSAIEDRQHLLSEVQGWMLWISLLLGLVGIGLIGWGFVGWRRQQRRHEDSEEEDLKRKRLDYRLASPAEVRAEQRKEEAEESANQEASDAAAQPGKSSAPQGALPAGPTPRERWDRLRATETKFNAQLALAFSGEYQVATDVRVVTESGRSVIVDVLAQAADGKAWAPFVVDTAVRMSSNLVHSTVMDRMLRLAFASQPLSGGSLPTGARGRPPAARAHAVLHLVVSTQNVRGRSIIQKVVTDVNLVLQRPVGVIVWDVDADPSDELDYDLDVLRASTVAALAQPNVVVERSLSLSTSD